MLQEILHRSTTGRPSKKRSRRSEGRPLGAGPAPPPGSRALGPSRLRAGSADCEPGHTSVRLLGPATSVCHKKDPRRGCHGGGVTSILSHPRQNAQHPGSPAAYAPRQMVPCYPVTKMPQSVGRGQCRPQLRTAVADRRCDCKPESPERCPSTIFWSGETEHRGTGYRIPSSSKVTQSWPEDHCRKAPEETHTSLTWWRGQVSVIKENKRAILLRSTNQG